MTVLLEHGGHVFAKGSRIGRKIDALISEELRRDPKQEVLRLWREKNVYNFYLKKFPPGSKEDDGLAMRFNFDTGAACTVFPAEWESKEHQERVEKRREAARKAKSAAALTSSGGQGQRKA